MNKSILCISSSDYEGIRWGRTFPLARALAHNGLEVVLLVSEKRKSLKLWHKRYIDGVTIICYNAIIPYRIRKLPIGLFTLNFIMRALYALFHKCDLVYSDCGETPCSGWPCKINQFIYKSKYLSEYGDLLGKGGYYDSKSHMYRILFGRYFLWAISYFRQTSDYVLVLSEVMRNYVIEEMKIVPEKTILVPGGSLPDKISFKELPNSLNREVRLGYIGIDDEELKGILPILLCIKKIYPSDFKIFLFGKKVSDSIIEKYGLRDIIVEHGWVDVIKGQNKISEVDIFLLMRKDLLIGSMGWPNKLGDYLSYGRPVMIDPYGDLVSFVESHEEGFIRVNRNDEQDICEKLKSILNENYKLSAMGKYNRQIAENEISWDARVKVLINNISY
ncbi:glycosyltransferase family protein [Bacteroides sp.]|uniref:hypothetical protein n=1 Tax=Bacteroides sp. TaxID=29523 RepID=UPI0025C4F4CF|nr:hypothetical protein [Bacteroides sp.]